MDSDKLSGTYYTPPDAIQFMMEYLKKEQQDFSNVLEPSAGDGRFLPLLREDASRITAIELFQEKVDQMCREYTGGLYTIVKDNFLDFAVNTLERYSLIIGNPPYINKKLMSKEDLEKAHVICTEAGLSKTVMQNMWLAFVMGSCRLLQPEGSIFFVLPMEFLQVQYAERLREHLEKIFNTIHIIVFQKALFPRIEQEVCLVYLTNKRGAERYIRYEIYEDCQKRVPIQENSIRWNKPLKKWSNAILNDSDISLLKNAMNQYPRIKNMGQIAPGIVTGGNRYFILSEEKVEKYKCREFVLPIVQKASYIPKNVIEISESVVKEICLDNKPAYLLNLSGEKDIRKLPVTLQKYLNWAGNQKVGDILLKDCYKCSTRMPWYGVPIVKKGEVVFFKRYGELPRIYYNSAGVHTTDAGYHIRLMDKFDGESLVFCFFNSLTLALCEFNGRYYGGGVCELVPTEFKDIVVPYRRIREKDKEKLKSLFASGEPVEDIVEFVNGLTIRRDYEVEQIHQFEEIRRVLMGRRDGKIGYQGSASCSKTLHDGR